MDRQNEEWLMGLTEIESRSLPLDQRHLRIRLLRQIEGMKGIRNQNPSQSIKKTKSYGGTFNYSE